MGQIDIYKKKILITGGGGYLGRQLIDKLLKLGAEVIVSIDIQKNVNKNVKGYEIDLGNDVALNDIVTSFRPDIIYHLAANLKRERDFSQCNELIKANLTGTINLLNSLKGIDYENFIFTSTSEVYGGIDKKEALKEDDNFIPASPYSLSKYCAELAIKTYAEIYSKNYTIFRVFNFYGPNMSPSFFLSQLIDKLKKNEDFNMTKGEQVRDFMHIRDLLEALVLGLDKKADKQIFNVCSSFGVSLKEIAITLKKITNSESNINFGKIPYRENEVWNMVGDNEKIKNILGWSPKIKIEGFLKN